MRKAPIYLYIDETGDTGFKFDKNSSTHFVVGMVSGDRGRIETAARDVRRNLRWRDDQEFKFSDSGDAAKSLYLESMNRTRFGAYIMTFDKRRLRQVPERDFYGYLVGLALQDVIEILNENCLVLDESFLGKNKKRTFRTELRARLTRPGAGKVLRALSYRGSGSDEMLQLADMVVGAAARVHRRGDDQYRRMIAARIISEHEYP